MDVESDYVSGEGERAGDGEAEAPCPEPFTTTEDSEDVVVIFEDSTSYPPHLSPGEDRGEGSHSPEMGHSSPPHHSRPAGPLEEYAHGLGDYSATLVPPSSPRPRARALVLPGLRGPNGQEAADDYDDDERDEPSRGRQMGRSASPRLSQQSQPFEESGAGLGDYSAIMVPPSSPRPRARALVLPKPQEINGREADDGNDDDERDKPRHGQQMGRSSFPRPSQQPYPLGESGARLGDYSAIMPPPSSPRPRRSALLITEPHQFLNQAANDEDDGDDEDDENEEDDQDEDDEEEDDENRDPVFQSQAKNGVIHYTYAPSRALMDKGSPPAPKVWQSGISFLVPKHVPLPDDPAKDDGIVVSSSLFRRNSDHGSTTYAPVTDTRRKMMQYRREYLGGVAVSPHLNESTRENVRGASNSPQPRARRDAIASTSGEDTHWSRRNQRALTPAMGSEEDRAQKDKARHGLLDREAFPAYGYRESSPEPEDTPNRQGVESVFDSGEGSSKRRREEFNDPGEGPSKRRRQDFVDPGEGPSKRRREDTIDPHEPNKRPKIMLRLRKPGKKVTAEEAQRTGMIVRNETDNEREARESSMMNESIKESVEDVLSDGSPMWDRDISQTRARKRALAKRAIEDRKANAKRAQKGLLAKLRSYEARYEEQKIELNRIAVEREAKMMAARAQRLKDDEGDVNEHDLIQAMMDMPGPGPLGLPQETSSPVAGPSNAAASGSSNARIQFVHESGLRDSAFDNLDDPDDLDDLDDSDDSDDLDGYDAARHKDSDDVPAPEAEPVIA